MTNITITKRRAKEGQSNQEIRLAADIKDNKILKA
jgi:hypothetical protein